MTNGLRAYCIRWPGCIGWRNGQRLGRHGGHAWQRSDRRKRSLGEGRRRGNGWGQSQVCVPPQQVDGQKRSDSQNEDHTHRASDDPWQPIHILLNDEFEIGGDGDQYHCRIIVPTARIRKLDQSP